MTNREEQVLVDGYRAIQIIFFAILGSLAMYAVIGLVLKKSVTGSAPGIPLEPLIFGLTAVGAGLTLTAWALRKFMLNRDLPKGAGDKTDEQFSPVDQAIQTYRNTIVIVAALAESIGIFGLVLLILGAGQSVFFTFLGLSAGVMWMLGPKFAELKALAEKYSKTL